jgi:SurA N-terminal domain
MQFRISTIIFCLIPVAVLAPGMCGQTNASRQPIARIGDQAIYDEDLLPSIGGKLFQLKDQEYELKSKALENTVNERLLESAAKSKGLSTDALLEQTVYRNLARPPQVKLTRITLPRRTGLVAPLARLGLKWNRP